MRQGTATYLFPGSNTTAGFLSFYRDGLQGLEHVFILKGGPGCGKSTLMRKIGLNLLERGYDVEFWQCSSDNDSLDGVIVPALSAAIVDGTPPHTLDPQYPGAVEELVDLGQYWRAAELRGQRAEIIDLSKRISEKFSFCYARLREAGALLSEQHQRNAALADEQRLDEQTAELSRQLFSREAAKPRHLFCSAVTPRGLISFSEPLSRRASRRFLLAGPPGCGKERIVARLAQQAEEQGHYAEIFHPALAPDSIELLWLPHLDTAVLCVATQPADLRPGDVVLSLPGAADEAIDQRLSGHVQEAAAQISEAKALHDRLEAVYRRAMDFPAVEAAGNQLFNRLLALTAAEE